MPKFVEPFPKALRGDKFGEQQPYRTHPHRGQDWKAPAKAIIPAIADAKVTQVFHSEILGWSVEFKTGATYWQINHLTEKPRSYTEGSDIKQGQPVGRVGDTGTAATGPHLHLAASKKKNVHLAPQESLIDPLTLFKD
jgi:murein DD-endopeptidase MepM/ murein hydrolase activator NlpD